MGARADRVPGGERRWEVHEEDLFPRRFVVVEGGSGAPPPRRVTRRIPPSVYWRRRAVLALAVLTLVVVAVRSSVPPGGADAPAVPASAATVTIAPGDTLWDVAVEHAPDGTDPRDYLARLRALNDLGGQVPAWTVVVLPPR